MAPRILLLDLEQDVRTFLRRVLTAGGFSVFEAENLAQAQQLISAADVDLFIASKEFWERRERKERPHKSFEREREGT